VIFNLEGWPVLIGLFSNSWRIMVKRRTIIPSLYITNYLSQRDYIAAQFPYAVVYDRRPFHGVGGVSGAFLIPRMIAE